MEIGAAINLQPGDHLSLVRKSRLDVVLKRNSKKVIANTPSIKRQLDTVLSVARQLKSSGKLNIVVAFFDGKAAAGKAWSTALSNAVAESLPILFVVKAGTAESSGDELQQIADQLNKRNRKLYFPVIPVDGKDVVAVYRVAFESGARVREGTGPALIVCETDERKTGQPGTRDPIDLMESYLAAKGLYKPAWKSAVLRRLDAQRAQSAVR